MLDWQKHSIYLAISLTFRAICLVAQKLKFCLKYIGLCGILMLKIWFGGSSLFGFLPRVFVRELSRIDKVGSVRFFVYIRGKKDNVRLAKS